KDVFLAVYRGFVRPLKNCRVLFSVCALALVSPPIPNTSLPDAVHSKSFVRSQSSDLNNIIDGLQRKYSRMQGLGADFVQVYRGSDGRIIREAGQLLLRRPGKARWEYSSPEHKLFVSDGKNVFFYVFGEKTATVSPIKETVDPQIPFLF